MSIPREIVYKCPYCGKEFEVSIYDSVNTRIDVDEVDKCKSGDIFKKLCPHCHTDFMLMNPFVYTDPDNKFVLYLSDDEIPESIHEIAEPLDKAGYKLRRCRTITEFTEKIQIFEDGIDDILVELAKYDSFIEFIDNRKGNAEDVSSIEYQHTKDDVMKINIRCDDKGLSFLIPMAGLEEVVSTQKDFFYVDNKTFPLINSDWIINLYQNVEGLPA